VYRRLITKLRLTKESNISLVISQGISSVYIVRSQIINQLQAVNTSILHISDLVILETQEFHVALTLYHPAVVEKVLMLKFRYISSLPVPHNAATECTLYSVNIIIVVAVGSIPLSAPYLILTLYYGATNVSRMTTPLAMLQSCASLSIVTPPEP